MKSTELRIGNLIYQYIKDEGFYLNTVDEDTFKSFIYHNEDGWDIYESYYDSIPLTEEWALKLGGKELPNGCVQFERFFIIPYDKGNNKWAVSHNGTNAHVTELHTVHELQNFFHCVGEELTTK